MVQRHPKARFRLANFSTALCIGGFVFMQNIAQASPKSVLPSSAPSETTPAMPEFPTLFPVETPPAQLEQSPLKPEVYPILKNPPYTARTVTAEPWAYPVNGFALYNLLPNAQDKCFFEHSTDGISRVGRGGSIPKNLRCARSVGYLLHRYVPQFQGHDWAETCARRIRSTLKAKKSRVYDLQEKIENAPEGYLYVICLLSSPKSRVGHICFYNSETQEVLGNSMGKWKAKPLEAFWTKYPYYYLLGIPVRTPQTTDAEPVLPDDFGG